MLTAILSGPEITAPVNVDTFAAGDTVIFVIVQTEIPQTDFGTDIQTVAHNPLVTVGEAAAVEVAFVAVVFHGTEREVTEIIGPRHSRGRRSNGL